MNVANRSFRFQVEGQRAIHCKQQSSETLLIFSNLAYNFFVIYKTPKKPENSALGALCPHDSTCDFIMQYFLRQTHTCITLSNM